MHQNREKIGLLRGIAVRPPRKMTPLVDLLKAGGGGKNVNDVVDGDRHTCGVFDFGVCRGPVYDSGVCKHLLSHVTRMVHTGKAKKRLFQLHIVNAGPHKPCCLGKVIRLLFGILHEKLVLRVDFFVIHHGASDMNNPDIRACRQRSVELCDALDGTLVLWQQQQQQQQQQQPRAPLPPPSLPEEPDHNLSRALEMLDAAVSYQQQEEEERRAN